MRPSIEQTNMDIAAVVAQRGTCSRLQVGAVLVRNTRVVASGYNGVASGFVHCSDPHPEGPCQKAIHAEMNVILTAASNGIPTSGAEMYVTHAPCPGCARYLIQAGIPKVTFRDDYRDMSGVQSLRSAGVLVVKFDEQ